MTHPRLRLLELGFLAAFGLVQAPRLAAADHPVPARELNYVYFHDDENTSMSGNIKDIERARRFKQPNQRVLWFRDGGQEYVVRDADTLAQVDVMWKPVSELGEAQGKLGSQQGELGSRQGLIGARQGLLGTRQGTLAVRESALDMRASQDGLSAADRAELAKQRRELQQQQRALEKDMRALEAPMTELGAQMDVLGRQMDVLGRKMDVASRKAEADMRALLRRAIASGLARPAR